ncbi:daptide biosynthesis RiPP recognition protein [Streptomyces aureoverticillatus]|uniref:daptide biosynthesis RiPP recognition protein n=1 Tax=Streptomyces aureoverticillatus TaxID=66871 RepID=UPI0013D9D630|nr:daptide biosynthesis RiPP recognition protein [Streptomyces aureoverticillatus]QIB45418.1 hypothetical protein G3H79_22440 [Streptomyces aureoverticillatus]
MGDTAVKESKESAELTEAGAADQLSAWFAGEHAGPRPAASSVLVQAGGDVRAVVDAGVLDPGACVFASASADLPEGGDLRAVEVEGGVEHSGDELVMTGSLYVQVFDYGSLPYLSVAGPTVVRVTGPEDYAAFLDDADRAVNDGVWPEGLTHPSVQLADLATLASPTKATGLGRLYITAQGQVRTGVGGQDLGHVTAGAEALRAALDAFAGDPSLGSVVPQDVLRAGAAERPWLGRYAKALEVRRRLAPKYGTDMRVSGFGCRFTDGLPALPGESTGQVLLVEALGDILAVRTDDYRLFKLGKGSACLLEVFCALGATSAPDAASDAATAAGSLLGMTADQALDAYATVTARLGLAGPHDVTTGGA